jgi:DnaK suppressor protein
MRWVAGRRTLGFGPGGAGLVRRKSTGGCARPTRLIERTRHVTSTVHDPVEVFRDVLEEQFQRHTDRLSELTVGAQQPDRGGYDKETLIALTVSCRRALADTAAALRRIAEGTYGSCKRCGVSIALDRLRAVPHAPFCLSCQRTQTG